MQDLTYNLNDIKEKFVLMFEGSSTNQANSKRHRNLHVETKGYPINITGPSNNLFCYCKADSLVETKSNVTIKIQTSSQDMYYETFGQFSLPNGDTSYKARAVLT